jgi:hypothetical protein
MIRQGQGRLAQAGSFLGQLCRPAHPIQQRIFTMHMKMTKIRHAAPRFKTQQMLLASVLE